MACKWANWQLFLAAAAIKVCGEKWKQCFREKSSFQTVNHTSGSHVSDYCYGQPFFFLPRWWWILQDISSFWNRSTPLSVHLLLKEGSYMALKLWLINFSIGKRKKIYSKKHFVVINTQEDWKPDPWHIKKKMSHRAISYSVVSSRPVPPLISSAIRLMMSFRAEGNSAPHLSVTSAAKNQEEANNASLKLLGDELVSSHANGSVGCWNRSNQYRWQEKEKKSSSQM